MSTNRWAGPIIAAGMAVLALGCDAKQPAMQGADCLLAAGCSFRLDGKPIHVKTGTPPSAARPFRLEVAAEQAKSVKAQFEMSGMNMTTPVYVLQKSARGWAAEIVLPVCVSGRSDWVLRLDVDQARIDIPFVASA